jgi:manganese/zinc/iron transport system ATP- binding protein
MTTALVTEPRPAVVVRDLTVAYGDRPALWDIDLDLPSGHLVAVVGPNGAGKSTLIKSILGLVPVAAGTIRLNGVQVRERRREIAYVPQRGTVDWDFPTDALDVVLMGTYGRLGYFRRPGPAERRLARDSLEQVGLADLAHRQIRQLSGGQQQRVFLARALAQRAEYYFMDEPFAGVDATTERTIVALLGELRRQGKTVIVVHHDLHTVREYFDYAVLLNVHVVASGYAPHVLVEENLKRAYGDRAEALVGAELAPMIHAGDVVPPPRS